MKQTFNPKKGRQMPKTYKPSKPALPEHYTQKGGAKK